MASRFVLTEAANADWYSRCYLREKIDVLPTLCLGQQLVLVAVKEFFTNCGIVGIEVLFESLEKFCARRQSGEPKIKVPVLYPTFLWHTTWWTSCHSDPESLTTV